MKARNLLVLSPWWPYPADNGSRLRAFHLIRELARCGHRIRLVAGVQDDVVDIVRQSVPEPLMACCTEVIPIRWRWYSEAESNKTGFLQALLSTTPRSVLETPNLEMSAAISNQLCQPTDAVLAFELGMDAYIPSLPANMPLIIDQVELSGGERAFHTAENWKTKARIGLTWVKSSQYWRKRLARYDLVTVVSEEEATAVRRVIGPGPRLLVLPNGVDLASFPTEPPTTRVVGQLLYNGALSYGPNRDAVHWFTDAILPIIQKEATEAHLVVTGRYTSETAAGLIENPNVRLTGFLPDLAPTLAASQVAVVALRSGGGTRLKIIEAFAAHLPVVSTTIGAAGLGAQSGTHLFLADTERDFADATVRLLSDPALAARIAANARQLAAERFDWRAIGVSLSEQLERAVVEKSV